MSAAHLPALAGAISLLGLTALVTSPSAAADASAPGRALIGRWATPGGGAVEFGACQEQGRQALTCGHIVALGDPPGSERLDARNPSARARVRHVLGLEIVSDLRQTAAGAWTAGALYNPDDGHTYRGAIRLLGDDRLELKGCALAVLCQKQVWRRAR